MSKMIWDRLLLNLIDINVQDDLGLTLLHLIDINVQDYLGLTLLHLIDFNTQNDVGVTPFGCGLMWSVDLYGY